MSRRTSITQQEKRLAALLRKPRKCPEWCCSMLVRLGHACPFHAWAYTWLKRDESGALVGCWLRREAGELKRCEVVV